jgi:hypothetical protein
MTHGSLLYRSVVYACLYMQTPSQQLSQGVTILALPAAHCDAERTRQGARCFATAAHTIPPSYHKLHITLVSHCVELVFWHAMHRSQGYQSSPNCQPAWVEG